LSYRNEFEKIVTFSALREGKKRQHFRPFSISAPSKAVNMVPANNPEHMREGEGIVIAHLVPGHIVLYNRME
jgi:hypothetical protein